MFFAEQYLSSSQLLADYQQASCSGASCTDTIMETAELRVMTVIPENPPDAEDKSFSDAATQCDIGVRWFDLPCKTVASVGRATSQHDHIVVRVSMFLKSKGEFRLTHLFTVQTYRWKRSQMTLKYSAKS